MQMELPTSPKGIFARAIRNAGLLLTGKAAAGILQLVTFAIAAKGLGLEQFGVFSIAVAQVTVFAGLAAFDSNQAIIRYGVGHLDRGNRRAFHALIKSGCALDLVSASLATVAVLAFSTWGGSWLGWNTQTIQAAQIMAPLAFANAVATPKGMLRLFNRFDVLARHALVTPGLRTIGFLVAWASGWPFWAWLICWLVAGWFGTIAGYVYALREMEHRDLAAGLLSPSGRASRANPGLYRFMLASNLNSSLALIPTHAATFIIGTMLGPQFAGLFRIAREFGTALMKPVDLVSQSLYPEIARLVHGAQWTRLGRVCLRAATVSSGIGITAAVLAAWQGAPILEWLFGAQYVAALPVLVVLAIGTSIRAISFPTDAVLYALGRAEMALALSCLANIAFLALLVWRLPIDGMIGAGYAWNCMALLLAAIGPFSAFFAVKAAMAPPLRHRMNG